MVKEQWHLDRWESLLAFGGLQQSHLLAHLDGAPRRRTCERNSTALFSPFQAYIATGIIKGLKDFKEGRFTRLKNADKLAKHFRNL